MICEKCGKSNADEAKFCAHCGAAIPEAPAVPVAAPEAAPAAATAVAAASKTSVFTKIKTFHQKHKLVIPIVAAVLVLAIIASVVLVTLGKQVSVSDYLKIEVTGYENYGEFNYDFDREAFALRAMGLKEYKGYGTADDLDEDDLEDLLDEDEKRAKLVERLVDSIKIKVKLPEGRENNLKNGDVIKITIDVSESRAEKLGITLKDTEVKYTVSNLAEPAAYDVLANFQVVFEGYEGYGKYQLVCNKTEARDMGELVFKTEEGQRKIAVYHKEDNYTSNIYLYTEGDNGNLSNGQTVSVYNETDANRWISNGVVLTNQRQDITVSGLKQIESFDLFANLKVEYIGLNGSGRAQIAYIQPQVTAGELTFDYEKGAVYRNGEYVTGLYFSLSSAYNLSNGDTITLSTSINESRLLQNGIRPGATEKTVTVENLAAYAENMDSIRNDLTEAVTETKNTLDKWLQDSWDYAVHATYWPAATEQTIVEAPVLHKAVLTTPENTGGSLKNTLWLVFKVTVNDSKFGDPTEIYIAMNIQNVAVRPDGTVYLSSVYVNKYTAKTSYDQVYSSYIQPNTQNIFE